MPRPTLALALVVAAAAVALAPPASAAFNLTTKLADFETTPKAARLNAMRNVTATKLAIAAAAANKTVSPKAAVAAEIEEMKGAILVKLNKQNATCSPGEDGRGERGWKTEKRRERDGSSFCFPHGEAEDGFPYPPPPLPTGYFTVSARRRALLANNGCAQCGNGYYCPGAPEPQAEAPRYQCPAGTTTTVPVATSIADCSVPAPPCSTASRYASYTNAGTTGTVATAPNVFAGTYTSQRSVGGPFTSATLGASTPWGGVYGSSAGKQYISPNSPTTSGSSSTVFNFSPAASPANQFGFALGDVDAESITISAIGTDGVPLTAAELGYQSSFNYAAGADVPTWNAGTSTLVGNTADTSGATGWFQPTRPIASLTLTSTTLSGSPQYQVWMAGFTCP